MQGGNNDAVVTSLGLFSLGTCLQCALPNHTAYKFYVPCRQQTLPGEIHIPRLGLPMFAAQEPCPAEMLVMSSAGDDGNPKRGMGISKDEIAARKAQQVCVWCGQEGHIASKGPDETSPVPSLTLLGKRWRESGQTPRRGPQLP